MLDNVTGNVGVHLAVGATASLLCTLLVMGLKLKWFRARMTFDQPDAHQEIPYVGVYRGTFSSDFDSPSTSSFTPRLPPSPPLPPPQPTSSKLTTDSKKHNAVQTNSKESKSKKTKENKLKVPKEKEVKTKPPKATKLKAPKLPNEVKPEVLKTTETRPKETKIKQSKVKAPKSPNEVTTSMSRPKTQTQTKAPKHKPKSQDNIAKQPPNGVANNRNVFTNVVQENAKPTNNSFLFIRPKNEMLPQPQEEVNNAVLRYSEDSFERGQIHKMKTFGSMMPSKGQVDLSVSPIPQHDTGKPRVLRNPIVSGLQSYQPPRDRVGVKDNSGSVYINMNAQPIKSDKQFFVNFEDESET